MSQRDLNSTKEMVRAEARGRTRRDHRSLHFLRCQSLSSGPSYAVNFISSWYSDSFLSLTFGQTSLRCLHSLALCILNHNVRCHRVCSWVEAELVACIQTESRASGRWWTTVRYPDFVNLHQISPVVDVPGWPNCRLWNKPQDVWTL